ncbi:MAG: hypothetical protein ACI4JY_04400 [Oscillospiraceae bacterium]
MDEATPHLHIDYIPVGHYKMGVDTQNGIAQALKEMGYGSGKDTISRCASALCAAECKVLTEICNRQQDAVAVCPKGDTMSPTEANRRHRHTNRRSRKVPWQSDGGTVQRIC